MRSIEHDTLSEMGLTWLAARSGSFRGASEVSIAPGYVADGCAVAVLYHSEFRRYCATWGLDPKTVIYQFEGEPPDYTLRKTEQGDILDYFACVFEAKSTRADFLSTFGGRDNSHSNRKNAAAHLHWIVTEPGICIAAEVPDFWGLLVRRGRGLSEIKPPSYCPVTSAAVLEIESKLLWKPPRGSTIMLPCCPRCNGPFEQRRRLAWNAKEPKHLMDSDPDDATATIGANAAGGGSDQH